MKFNASKTAQHILQIFVITVNALFALAEWLLLRSYPIIMWSAIALYTLFAALVSFVYLPAYFTNIRYVLRRGQLSKSTGFYITTTSSMKTDAIQYVTLITTPLSEYTGLNFISVNALGGRLILMFMRRDDAEKLYSALRKLTSSHGSEAESGERQE